MALEDGYYAEVGRLGFWGLEMNHRQGLKGIMKRVIVPKIDDRRQKRLVEQTIDAVMPNE